jgi:hypothetical protein
MSIQLPSDTNRTPEMQRFFDELCRQLDLAQQQIAALQTTIQDHETRIIVLEP